MEHTDVSQGKLIIDATCTPADIAYPTDLNILNEAREKTEEIIDAMHVPFIGIEQKPRTYRRPAGLVCLGKNLPHRGNDNNDKN